MESERRTFDGTEFIADVIHDGLCVVVSLRHGDPWLTVNRYGGFRIETIVRSHDSVLPDICKMLPELHAWGRELLESKGGAE